MKRTYKVTKESPCGPPLNAIFIEEENNSSEDKRFGHQADNSFYNFSESYLKKYSEFFQEVIEKIKLVEGTWYKYIPKLFPEQTWIIRPNKDGFYEAYGGAQKNNLTKCTTENLARLPSLMTGTVFLATKEEIEWAEENLYPKKPLFKTTDGVDIYKGDIYYTYSQNMVFKKTAKYDEQDRWCFRYSTLDKVKEASCLYVKASIEDFNKSPHLKIVVEQFIKDNLIIVKDQSNG